jgi:hypothetical protein
MDGAADCAVSCVAGQACGFRRILCPNNFACTVTCSAGQACSLATIVQGDSATSTTVSCGEATPQRPQPRRCAHHRAVCRRWRRGVLVDDTDGHVQHAPVPGEVRQQPASVRQLQVRAAVCAHCVVVVSIDHTGALSLSLCISPPFLTSSSSPSVVISLTLQVHGHGLPSVTGLPKVTSDVGVVCVTLPAMHTSLPLQPIVAVVVREQPAADSRAVRCEPTHSVRMYGKSVCRTIVLMTE